MSKVVIITPINENKAYCIHDFISNVKSFSYKNITIVMVDNSPTKDFMNELSKLHPDIHFIYDKQPDNIPLSYKISISQQKAFEKALLYSPDHILSLECDVFPPTDCIERLINHNKDVVGFTYPTGLMSKRKPILMQVRKTPVVFSLYEVDKIMTAQIFDGNLKQVSNIGLGCLLFSKNVFQYIKFEANKDTYSDSILAMRFYKHGIDVFVDTTTILKHINSEKQYERI